MTILSSWNVVPRYSLKDSGHCRFSDIERSSYLSVGRPGLPHSTYSNDPVGRQASARYTRPFGMVSPVSSLSVAGIIFLRSKVKMQRVTAWSVVAFMKNIEAGWYFSVGKLPGYAVRLLGASDKPAHPVPKAGGASLPWPARNISATPIDSIPEVLRPPINWRQSMASSIGIMFPAESARMCRTLAALNGTDFDDVGHGDPPSRIGGQGRRPVASRLRPVFYVFLIAISTLLDASGNVRAAGTITGSVTP